MNHTFKNVVDKWTELALKLSFTSKSQKYTIKNAQNSCDFAIG